MRSKLFLSLFVTLFISTSFAMTPLTPSLKVKLEDNHFNIDGFEMNFQRTLRIPDDGKTYPLPPSLGSFPIYRVKDYAKKLPQAWNTENSFFIPMYQREAMWISFEGKESWKPRAIKIGVGKINIITGESFNPQLTAKTEQDYFVAPTPQPWVDGIKSGKDYIRQFVAMRLGEGYTVEGQITGEEKIGGLQIVVYNPKPGIFKKSTEIIKREKSSGFAMSAAPSPGNDGEMGLAAGGKMTQKFYPDPHGLGTWDPTKFAMFNIYILNSKQFEKTTGKKAPESPITKKDYELYDYPWFALYDEAFKDLKASNKLKKIKSVHTIDQSKGQETPDNPSMKPKKIIKYEKPK